MYLLAFNLSDVGEMQRNFDHVHCDILREEEICKLHQEVRIVSVARAEEAEGMKIIERRLKVKFFELEVDFPEEVMAIEGVIVAKFDNAPNLAVQNGEPYTSRNLVQSPVTYRLYKPIEA